MTVHSDRFDPCCPAPAVECPAPACPPCSSSGWDEVTRTEIPIKRVGWDQFLGNVSYEAARVPDDVAADYVRSAAIWFARRTGGLVRRWYIDVTPGFTDYYPQIDPSEELYRIDSVCLNGSCLAVGNRARCTGAALCGCGLSSFTFEAPDRIEISGCIVDSPLNTPLSGQSQLEIIGRVFPSETACEVDELLFRYHHEAIKARALASLFRIPERPWTNFALAKFWEREAHAQRAWAVTEQLSGRAAARGPLHLGMTL